MVTGCKELTATNVLKVQVVQIKPDTAKYAVQPVMWDSQVDTVAVHLTDGSGALVQSDNVVWTTTADSIVSVQPWAQCHRPAAADTARTADIRACLTANRSGDVTIGLKVAQAGLSPETVSFHVRVNEKWTSVAAGRHFTCAVNVHDRLFCWGDGTLIGNGSSPDANVPTAVALPAGLRFSAVHSGGSTTCAVLDPTSVAYCWGDNAFGQAGLGRAPSLQYAPTVVENAMAFLSIAVGNEFSCGISREQPTPSPLASKSGYVTCGGRSDGLLGLATVLGEEACIQLQFGNNAGTKCFYEPGVQYPLLDPAGNDAAASIAVGLEHACAVNKRSRSTFCWGRNDLGQVNGTSSGSVAQPVIVTLAGVADSVTAGYSHTCSLLLAGGAVSCWGRNNSGEAGSFGTTGCPRTSTAAALALPCVVKPQPIPQPGGAFTSLAAGSNFTCGLTTAGAAYCWGDNDFGQLGTSSTLPGSCFAVEPDAEPGATTPHGCSGVPVLVAQPLPLPRTFTSLGVGAYHACGVTAPDGALFCWGLDDLGQLGNGKGGTATGCEFKNVLPTRVVEPDFIPAIACSQSQASAQRVRPTRP